MLYFVTFVHIISGMVYFALPMVFPRWFRAALDHPPMLQTSTAKMLLYARLHLNATAALSTLTGIWLVVLLGISNHAWLGASFTLLILSLVNINVILCPALKTISQSKDAANPSLANARKRLSFFAATHHTLVTILVALMVFRPLI